MNLIGWRMISLIIILIILPAQLPAQSVSQSYQPPARAGVAQDRILKLSLNEAIAMMLENNLDVHMEKNKIQRNRFSLQAAEGVYDYNLGAQSDYIRSTKPTISALQGDPRQFIIESRNYNANLSRQFANGSSLRAEFNNNYLSTNNRFFIFEPVYTAQLSFNYRQPLLKNFRINEHQQKIRALKEQLNLSDQHFRKKLIDLVAQTEAAYYELAFALADEKVKCESVQLAAEQIRRNQDGAATGKLAPVEVTEAEAEMEKRKEDVLIKLMSITEAENTLKTIIIRDPASELWNYQIVPTDAINYSSEVFNIDEAIKLALVNRPDFKELDSQGKINKINIDFFKNQLKPQLDLIASFTTEGIAGSADRPNFFNIRPKSDVVGGYGTALSNIFLFRTYQVGISISWPLRNHTARANLAEAKLAREHIDLEREKLIHSITSEVRNAIQALQMNLQRITAAQQSIKAAEKRLEAEKARFQVGLSTTFFVLKSQETVSMARSRELRAITDYIKARAKLQHVIGNNLP